MPPGSAAALIVMHTPSVSPTAICHSVRDGRTVAIRNGREDFENSCSLDGRDSVRAIGRGVLREAATSSKRVRSLGRLSFLWLSTSLLLVSPHFLESLSC